MTSAMRQLLTRRFTVHAAPAFAWRHLAAAEQWPSWAHHLRKVELTPAGPVGENTQAVLTLTNRTRAKVAVTDFVDGHRFRWDGTFLWLRLGYDHRVEPADAHGSEVTFRVLGGGIGISTLGRLFARIHARNLDLGIPRLQNELADLRHDPIANSESHP